MGDERFRYLKRKCVAAFDKILCRVFGDNALDYLLDTGRHNGVVIINADILIDLLRVCLFDLIVHRIGDKHLLDVARESRKLNARDLGTVIHANDLLEGKLDMHARLEGLILNLTEGGKDTRMTCGDCRNRSAEDQQKTEERKPLL